MKTNQQTGAAYELISYKVATRMAMEGYPLDYEVECPDGTVLCLANEGDGGPDYLKATRKGRKWIAATRDDNARLDALSEWCAMRDPERAKQIADAKKKPKKVKVLKPTPGLPRGGTVEEFSYGDKPTIEDVGIWAEDLGNELQVQKTIARKVKKTVCYRLPGSSDIGYYTVRRGTVMTDDTRRKLAAKILGNNPEATVYGSGWEPCANCEKEKPEVTGNVVVCKACVNSNGEAK